jgi:hypothetical protein
MGTIPFYLAPGHLGFAYLAGSGFVDANSPPSFTAGSELQVRGYNLPSETTIWQLGCDNTLTAVWTNSDGTQQQAAVYYNSNSDFLGLTGDIHELLSNSAIAAYIGEVSLVFTIPSSA